MQRIIDKYVYKQVSNLFKQHNNWTRDTSRTQNFPPRFNAFAFRFFGILIPMAMSIENYMYFFFFFL